MLTRLAYALAVVATLVTACGAGRAVRPEDKTGSGALGGDGPRAICHDVKAEGTPFIVDWRPEDRGALEVVMKRGIAIVHYDCDSLRVLPDCYATGDYAFVGVTKKEQVVSLADADEAKANLPFSGAKLGASLEAHSAINIGLVMVGMVSTPSASVAPDAIRGKCDGATHFIRSATVGAFAMLTDAAGAAHAAADVFGVGASGGSTSTRRMITSDGERAACSSADPSANAPPGQCGALLKLRLVAMGGAASSGASSDASCPAGTAAIDGKCTAKVDPTTKKCVDGDVDACGESCKAGVAAGCATLVDRVAEVKPPRYDVIAALSKRACELGMLEACGHYSLALIAGVGVPADPPTGVALATKSCAEGSGRGCNALGAAYEFSTKADPARALYFYARGCSLGNGSACARASDILIAGKQGVPADPPRAVLLAANGCDAREGTACGYLGVAFEKGIAVKRDAAKALKAYRAGCELNDQDSCKGEARLAGQR